MGSDREADVTPDGAAETADVVVGGVPSGCSAGGFTGRYGLETVVFDRGPAASPRCAHLSES